MKKFIACICVGILFVLPAFAGTENFMKIEFWKNATVSQVQKEIENGADVKFRNKDGFTPLICASMINSDPKVFEILIKNGADVKAKNKLGITALMYASRENPNLDVIKTLIKNRADVNAGNGLGMTPLIYASRKNPNPKIVEILIENGAEITKVDFDFAKENPNLYQTDVYFKMQKLMRKKAKKITGKEKK